ncbi:MAG TPA: putative lipid II flippase FtsW [Thiolapillus brandeum]|uniref:Probable peptidoglycan glycosyltransferase FtsW n=1 Tax=Thiolapillus brandeum TaxID=1076588 RepID=A0A831WDW2_9GAMM|nr:putative lipid II flippase FtsW [Thiolapillus brandeum]
MSAVARPRPLLSASALSVDWVLLLAVLALVGLGVVMVSSASLHLAGSGNPFHYLSKHLIALSLGTAAALITLQIPSNWWEKGSTWLYFLGLLLLVIVLIPGLGKTVNGATRWVAIGPFNLQTSEFMKLFMIFFMAGYLVRRQVEVAHTVWGVIKPLLLLSLAVVLLMAQPDFGTTVVLLATALGLLFLGGAPLWQFGLLLLLAVLGGVVLVITSPYRLERVTSFLNPWADPLDSGYQLSQALIAFGRGEWTGVGLGNGIQKQFYLPEAHTDFIMAVIGEEFGLVGTLTVIALFSILVWRAFSIGAAAEAMQRRFAAYVAYGIGLWLGLQAFINVGVNVGMLPTKGLTLPFVSYGSNSMIIGCVAIAVLLRIHWENRTGKDGPGGIPWRA